jgi:hypothetical protein
MNTFNIVIKNKTNVYLNGEKLKRKYKTGSLRRIFYGEKYVLKMEIIEDDWCQCKEEWDIWRKLPKKHKKYFIPILHYYHGKEWDIVIEPRLKLSYCFDDAIEDTIWNTELRAIAKKYGLIDLEGRMNENWFMHNGSPIITE